MEIVFHRYGSICEPDIMEAFQSLGLTVIEEDAEIYQKSIEPEKRISMLAEAILTHQTSFVFSINYFPYISQVCERLHVLYLCLSVDCPVLELFSETIRNGCNRIFLFDYEQYEQIRGENADNIFYLPLGANVARFWKSTHWFNSVTSMMYLLSDPFIPKNRLIKGSPYQLLTEALETA